jgi:hypothetical protein
MFRDTEASRTPAPPSASPSPVDVTLAYLPIWIEQFDRRMLATDARWLILGEECPEINGDLADHAARSIYDKPAIVWG